MWWKRKPKELHGITTICKWFNINGADLMSWHRSRADPPPMWRENAVWCCEIRTMKKWLKENNLLPKRASLLEILKKEREHRHERRKIRNQRNWQRTISKGQGRDWTVTPDKLKKGSMW